MASQSQTSSSSNLSSQSLNYRSLPTRIAGKPKNRDSREQQQLCSYIHRICLQNRLDGFDYCIRHILEDRTAPFRQCSYVHPQSSKRCPNAARRTDRRDSTLCPWHIKKLYLKRKQAQIHQMRLNTEEHNGKNETKKLLKDLEHYCPNTSHENTRTNINWVQQEDGSITASEQLRKKISEAAANLNVAEDDDDESGNALVEDVMRPDIMDSDSESIDSDHEDPLKHAGIYTSEEVSLVLRDKMLRLQSLYIEQFKNLQYLLREKRRKYLNALKLEKQIPEMNSISQLINSEYANPQTKLDYAKLKAMWRYHRARGPEALLKMQAREKRKAAIEGENYKPPIEPICIFIKDDEACTNRSLPFTNYCRKHILYDVHQVLFRPCAAGTPPCLNPIISIVYKNTCLLHRELKVDKNEISKKTNEDDASNIAMSTEPELFQTMDDIASLALDAVAPGNLFGLDQFGDLGTTDLLPTNL